MLGTPAIIMGRMPTGIGHSHSQQGMPTELGRAATERAVPEGHAAATSVGTNGTTATGAAARDAAATGAAATGAAATSTSTNETTATGAAATGATRDAAVTRLPSHPSSWPRRQGARQPAEARAEAGQQPGAGGLVALVSPHLEDGPDERTRTPFANLVRLTSRNSFYQQWRMQETTRPRT